MKREVIAAGPGARNEQGHRVPLDAVVGQHARDDFPAVGVHGNVKKLAP